jgi:hypothetical protein
MQCIFCRCDVWATAGIGMAAASSLAGRHPPPAFVIAPVAMGFAGLVGFKALEPVLRAMGL